MNEKTLVLNSDQLRCIASPLRSELLGAGVRLRQFSVNELAEGVERNPKALYPHVRQMVEVGLFKQIGERLSGKRIEAVYAPVSQSIEIPRDNFDPAYRDAIRKKIRAVVRQTEREYMRYLDSVTDEDRSLSLRYFLKLTPARIVELKSKLMEIGKWAQAFEDEEGTEEVAATFLAAPLRSGKDV
jgi:hypothetical protein